MNRNKLRHTTIIYNTCLGISKLVSINITCPNQSMEKAQGDCKLINTIKQLRATRLSAIKTELALQILRMRITSDPSARDQLGNI